jgi:CRISPR-associated Csx2 family protein
MARKVFISVLGAGYYGTCKYVDKNESFVSSETRFIQHATLEKIGAQQWSSDDAIFIPLTDTARKSNWEDSIKHNRDTDQDEHYIGLKNVLKQMQLPCPVIDVPIPDGKDEKEIWEIFSILFNLLKDEGDELYIDLTHGFRYLPMLVLVLGNYAKFLKNVVVEAMTYGNYEAKDKNTNEAPFVNLLPLSVLQDWTFAAGQYLDSGNVTKLFDLSSSELRPILAIAQGKNIEATKLKQFVMLLKTVIEERQTCRGISIVNSNNFKNLKEVSEQLNETIIEPLNPIIDKIKESFIPFDINKNASNGFAAAKWCYDNALYQQAATILHENMITAICMQEGLNWSKESDRSVVNIAFKVAIDKIEEKCWNLGLKTDATEMEKEHKRNLIRKTFNNKLFISFTELFNAMNGLRNDYNHSGMRNNPMTPLSIKRNLGKILEDVIKLYNEVNSSSEVLKKGMLINLSNHPYAKWDEKQKAAASVFGECKDIAFPDIDPSASENDIAALSDEYLQKILRMTSNNTIVVHVMGEMTFTFCLVKNLLQNGIRCIASCARRNVTTTDDGIKHTAFNFECFRDYV